MPQLIYASGLLSVAACSPQVLPHCHLQESCITVHCNVYCFRVLCSIQSNNHAVSLFNRNVNLIFVRYISFSCGELENVISINTLTQCITFQVQAHPGGRFVKLLRATDQYSQHEMCVHKGVS